MARVLAAGTPMEIAGLSGGIRLDVPPHKVPIGASPSLRNVSVGNGQVRSVNGWSVVDDTHEDGGSIVAIGQWQALPYSLWDPIICMWGPSSGSEGAIRLWDPINTAWYDITPSDFSWVLLAPPDNTFIAPPSMCVSPDQKLIVVNSAGCWEWNPEEQDNPLNPGAMTGLVGIGAAGITAAFTAASVGPHLLLGGVEMDDQWEPQRYYWCQTNNSDLWTIGFNDETEVDSLAGFADLPYNDSDQSPSIMRIMMLRDQAMIYTKENVYSLEFVGAPFIFVRRLVQTKFGLRSWESVVDMGDRHIVAAWDGDFYEFNGFEKQSIGAPIRDWVNKNVQGYIRGYRRFKDDCAVFYFSTSADTPLTPDTAVVFNVKEGSWTIEDFDFVAAANVTAEGIDGNQFIVDSAIGIDDLTGTIATLNSTYGVTRIDELPSNVTNEYFRNQDQVRINREVMGGSDGILYRRSGWTKAGSPMTYRWRTHVFHGENPLQVQNWSSVLVGLVEEGLNFIEDSSSGDTPYNVRVNLYTSNDPYVDWDSLPVKQFRTYTYGDDPSDTRYKGFRTKARYAQIEITSTSEDDDDERPWVLEQLIVWMIAMGIS